MTEPVTIMVLILPSVIKGNVRHSGKRGYRLIYAVKLLLIVFSVEMILWIHFK